MEDKFGLSVRTEDTSGKDGTSSQGEDFDISLVTSPATSEGKLGFVALVAMKFGPSMAPLNASQGIKGGINEAGLSCDKQSLSETSFPSLNQDAVNIDGALLCRWALEVSCSIHNHISTYPILTILNPNFKGFKNTSSLRKRLEWVNFIAPAHDENFANGHWVLRDAIGEVYINEILFYF